MTATAAAVATWTAALARSSAFAATAPLAGSGAMPRALRVALALSLTPAVEARIAGVPGQDSATSWFDNALIGIAFGLAAALVASAASAAGSLFDAALVSKSIGGEAVLGGEGGPFTRLFALAFASAFLGTGAMTQMCERFVTASSDAALAPTGQGAVNLIRACCAAAIALASPALLAQLLGTLVAAAAARAAPRVNGLMLSSPLITTLLLSSVVVAAPATFARIITLARDAAFVPPL